MICRTCEAAIVDMARGVDVGAGTAAWVETHVGQCAACAERYRREEALSSDLRGLAGAAAGLRPSASLEGRLLEEFAAVRRQPERIAPRTVRIGLGVAAALVLLALGGLASWRLQPVTGRPVVGVTEESSSVKPTVPAETIVTREPVTEPVRREAPPRSAQPNEKESRARRPARPSPPSLQIAGFVSLPGAAAMPDFDSGSIVRVSLALESLPTYGVDIVPDSASNRVAADLLVGQDGQARAIRLVTIDAESRRGNDAESRSRQ